jgi:hypothetical protein
MGSGCAQPVYTHENGKEQVRQQPAALGELAEPTFGSNAELLGELLCLFTPKINSLPRGSIWSLR